MPRTLSSAAYAFLKNKISVNENLIKMISVKVGVPVIYGSGAAFSLKTVDNATGGLIVELETADKRKIRTPDFIDGWRQEINLKPGLKTLTIQQARGGPPGRDVDVRLLGPDIQVLKTAASDVINLVKRYLV